MHFPRSSGILIHVTSLPGRFGIGDFGDGARAFLDFLQLAGQSIWQILPLGPPAQGDSPYSCYSAFAINPRLICPMLLVQDGWLPSQEFRSDVDVNRAFDLVDHAAAWVFKQQVLEAAYVYFLTNGDSQRRGRFEAFCQREKGWLTDYARFDALMSHFQNPDWTTWEQGLVQRESQSLANWDERLQRPIEFAKFSQFLLDDQWQQLKRYANARHIRVFGDMPIFVAHHSSDVWANQDLFLLDRQGRPTVVAGVPPDYFSATGQLWGNPLYDWKRLAEQNFGWWVDRFQSAFRLYDMLRIDHFRGFESYWEIPSTASTAVEGRWMPGPMEAPFQAAYARLGSNLSIVAEDLGMITAAVHALRDQLQFPGMRVLQFGFDHADDSFHRPDHYPVDSVAYTGTHDNDTVMGWYADRRRSRPSDPLLDQVLQDAHLPVHIQLIRAVLESAAHTAIFPMQDLLGLGSESRLNTPGQAEGNWRWRCPPDAFQSDLAHQLRHMTEASHRLGLY